MTQMTIFGKALADVEFKDVVDFCNRSIPEGMNIDYKVDLKDSIAKTIAAFANTNGGYLVVGVSEEDEKPKPPFDGMEWRESLALDVTNIVVDSIYPYFT